MNMSHDRGCPCGREKWEYSTCPQEDCFKDHGHFLKSLNKEINMDKHRDHGDEHMKKGIMSDPNTGQGDARGPGYDEIHDYSSRYTVLDRKVPRYPTDRTDEYEKRQDVNKQKPLGVEIGVKSTPDFKDQHDTSDERADLKPTTGGLRYNTGKNRMELVPPEWEWALADVTTQGSKKYEARNWERGMNWSYMIGCMKRHINKFLVGEQYDGTEFNLEKGTTGCHHLAMVAWNALALMSYDLRRIGNDDLPNLPPEILDLVNAVGAIGPKTEERNDEDN
jgi:hypothetical protein